MSPVTINLPQLPQPPSLNLQMSPGGVNPLGNQMAGQFPGMGQGSAQNLLPILEELLQIVVQLLEAMTGGPVASPLGSGQGLGGSGLPGGPLSGGMPGSLGGMGSPSSSAGIPGGSASPIGGGTPMSGGSPSTCGCPPTCDCPPTGTPGSTGTPSNTPAPNPTTPSSGSITGDPHFDVNGKHFDFQGQAGATYNEVYDPSTGFTDNTTFKSIGGNQSVRYVGAEGLSFDGNQLSVQAGPNGEQVDLNGQQLTKGSYLNGEVAVNNGSVTVRADNFDFTVQQQGSGNGAYLDTNFKADLTANQQAGLKGIVGSVLANPNANVDPTTLSQQDQVPGLFNNNNGTGPVTGSGGGSGSGSTDPYLVAALLQDAASLLQIAAQMEGGSSGTVA